MAEYIEREAAKRAFFKGHEFVYYGTDVYERLDDIPAADVVPVVRCKDCEYSVEAWVNEKGFLICPASGMDITGDDYCSYGVKMGAEKDV